MEPICVKFTLKNYVDLLGLLLKCVVKEFAEFSSIMVQELSI